MGFLRDFTSAPVVGGNPQGWSELRISNDEIAAAGWPGPPRKSDRVIADGGTRMVESCETRRKGEAVAIHVIRLSGG